MSEIVSTLTSKGQVTLPIEVRRHLGVSQADKVVFIIDPDDGTVRLTVPRYPDVASLVGAAGTLPSPMSWKEMLAIAYEDRFAGRNE